jgi:hypothetical protein
LVAALIPATPAPMITIFFIFVKLIFLFGFPKREVALPF